MFLNTKIVSHVFYIFFTFLYLSAPFLWRILVTGPSGSMLDSWTPLSDSLEGIHPTTIFIYILPFTFFCLVATIIQQPIFTTVSNFYSKIVLKFFPIISTLIYVNFIMRDSSGVSLYSEDMVGEFPFYGLQFLSVALFLTIYSLFIYFGKEKFFLRLAFILLIIGFIMSVISPITTIMMGGRLNINTYGGGAYEKRYAGRLEIKPGSSTIKTAKISLWNTGGKTKISTEIIAGSGRERNDEIICSVLSIEPNENIHSGEKSAIIYYVGTFIINYECTGEFISTAYLFPKSTYYKELPFTMKNYHLPPMRFENLQHLPIDTSNPLW